MSFWDTDDTANSVPYWLRSEYPTNIVRVWGDEGLPVSAGWARKTIGSGLNTGRTFYESIVSFTHFKVPYPAPDGYRWKVETYGGEMVLYQGEPCFYLEKVY